MKLSKIRLSLIFLCIIEILPQSKTAIPKITAVDFTSSNLPIVIINTNGQIITDEPKITADMGIIYNEGSARNNITDPYNNYSGKIGIEIRGSSSQMYPKKQYGIETRDAAGEDSSVSLLGFPEESDWILYAPYIDKTLIRDVLIYRLTNDLGHYATRSKFCELVLNNEYMGVYVLFEKIKRDKNRVDVSKIDEADTTGDDLTGGYIIKIDKDEGENNAGWISEFPPYQGAWQRTYYQYDTPEPEDITPQQADYIQSFIKNFETMMNSQDFDDPVAGYESIIDVNTFIDFFILNEFSKNVDGFRLSAFMHKDKDSKGGKLKMGPVWDFNFSLGNVDYYNSPFTDGFHLVFLTTDRNYRSMDSFQPPFWWKRLFDEAQFKAKLSIRWNELRKDQLSLEKVYFYIDSLTNLLSEARTRNFEKWQILREKIWPNYYVGYTYEGEISYLKTWIKDRLEWIDKQFPATSVINGEYFSPDFILYQNYPNPFNPVTKIKYAVGYENENQSQPVLIKLFDILGNEVRVLINTEQSPGEYEVEFNGSELTSGIYYYQLICGNFRQTKKLMLLK